MKAIKWLKMCYTGLDLGAIYPVEKEWLGEYDGFFLIYDEFGRGVTLHKRYLGVLFTEANYAS
jgi:hypothetical protein